MDCVAARGSSGTTEYVPRAEERASRTQTVWDGILSVGDAEGVLSSPGFNPGEAGFYLYLISQPTAISQR